MVTIRGRTTLSPAGLTRAVPLPVVFPLPFDLKEKYILFSIVTKLLTPTKSRYFILIILMMRKIGTFKIKL